MFDEDLLVEDLFGEDSLLSTRCANMRVKLDLRSRTAGDRKMRPFIRS